MKTPLLSSFFYFSLVGFCQHCQCIDSCSSKHYTFTAIDFQHNILIFSVSLLRYEFCLYSLFYATILQFCWTLHRELCYWSVNEKNTMRSKLKHNSWYKWPKIGKISQGQWKYFFVLFCFSLIFFQQFVFSVAGFSTVLFYWLNVLWFFKFDWIVL